MGLTKEEMKAYEKMGQEITRILSTHVGEILKKWVDDSGPENPATPDGLTHLTMKITKEVANIQSLTAHAMVMMIAKTVCETAGGKADDKIHATLYDLLLDRMKDLKRFKDKPKSRKDHMDWSK